MSRFQSGQHLFVETVGLGGVLVSGLGGLLDFGGAGLNRFQVFQLQLHINHLLVSNGVDTAIDVNHVAVIETPQQVQDGISLADVSEKLVAQALPLARPFYKPGNVHNLNGGGNHILWLDQFGEFLQPRVGNRNHANVGFNGAKRKIRALCLGVGQAVEQGGFTDVGESNNAAF